MLACSAGVLLGRVRVTTLQPPFWTAMLDGGGWGRGKMRRFSSLHPSLILPLAYHSPPWENFLSLPSLPLHEKFKMAAKLFTM